MAVPLLDIRDLTVEFSTRRGIVRAVEHVAISIAKGETVGIVGESGSGKSVTSYAVMRILDRAGKIVEGAVYFTGLDVRAAVGMPPSETERLRHVAWIVYSARPYAFQVAGRQMPPGDLRVELEAPDGSTWALGPEDADNRITGTALEYCRVGVQRMPLSDAATLKAEGDLAHAALEVARAFL